MDDRFDQEFYRSVWQRVLATTPDGIQPYIHTARLPQSAGLPSLGRVIALLGAAARRAIAFGRFAASGTARQAMSSEVPQRRSALPLVHATVRPMTRQAQAPRRPSRGRNHGRRRRAAPVPLEKTETIERARRHHRETHGD